MRSEDELIAVIRRRFPEARVALGIGDDAALVDLEGRTAITTDLLVEGVDFTGSVPIGFVASKALAVNLSDLAAMGARPATFLLTLAFPSSFDEKFDDFIEALARAAEQYRIDLIGGDLSAAPVLTISITAIGSIDQRALTRSGARKGERIYLSRPVGASATGLALLQKGWSIDPAGAVDRQPESARGFGYAQREFAAAAIGRHLAPEPELTLGGKLAAMEETGACIDVSDGLSADLSRLCRASECGALIEWERIPRFPDLDRTGATLGINADEAVLHGGEEYALLFTSALREAELSERLGRPVYAIGTVAGGAEILVRRGGKESPMEIRGFDHFK